MKYSGNGFDFGDFEITKREILASISIVAVMILFGILISSKISEYQMDKNEIYNKAVKIENSEMFQYGMDTNVGYSFVYGDLKAVDTVTYPEIEGEYMYVEKVEERYTMHTQEVKHSNGKTTWYTTETYWTWDKIGSENIKCEKISFCGVNFESYKIELPYTEYINTIETSNNVRYKYYGIRTEYKGTIFTDLRNKTISDNTYFYNNFTIEKTIKYLEVNFLIAIFWILWIILIGGIVFGFYYLDNNWLK